MCTVKRKLLQPFPYTELPGPLVGEKKEKATYPPPPVSPGQLLFLVNSWTAPG